MKKIAVYISTLAVFALPLVASAHEHDNFKIGDSYYQFVVGSLNEPVTVDDKTGLDLTINKCFNASCTAKMSPDGDMDGPAGTPVTGLESSLKVELVAGDQKKSLDISPQWGQAGKYQTTFYPTVATTFSYHLTGEVDKNPIDLTFTCVPSGTPKAADDTTPAKLSDSVTRMVHGGAFGCPETKEDLGFPKTSASIANVSDETGAAKGMATGALALGAVGTALGVMAFIRRRN